MKQIICSFLVALVFFSPYALGAEKDYVIGAGDVLDIKIYAGGESQQELTVTVYSKGDITVSFIGRIDAKGLTTSELADRIAKKLNGKYYIDPEVLVSVREYHSLRYFISGAVQSPGEYTLTSQPTLLELIAKAGGVLPTRGNVAYILKQDLDVEHLKPEDAKDPVKIDLAELLDRGDVSHDIKLDVGCLVYIPHQNSLDQSTLKIYVEGQVKQPGVYDYQSGLTALKACITAGGFAQFAAPNRASVIRPNGDKREVIKINLEDVQKGVIPDLQLKPGDRVLVPETWL
jgi:polysaccharide export outer membrane protein